MKSRTIFRLALFIIFAAALCLAPSVAQPVKAAPPGGITPTYWINDPGDAADAVPGNGICDTGTGALAGTGRLPCTLRAALQEANAAAGAARVIAFEICPTDFASNGDGAGSYRISPATPLPAMTNGLTYINGYTQGYGQTPARYDDPATNAAACNGATTPRLATPNTNSFSLAVNTVLAIEIDGSSCVSPAPQNDADFTTPVSGGVIPSGSIIRWNGTAGACSGFTVTSDRNVFAGLNIRNWRNAGILIMPLTFGQGNKPSENAVWGSFIGTNLTGDTAQANRFGLEIVGRSHSNYIGDTLAIPTWGTGDTTWAEEPTNNERNLLSGNDNPYFIYGNTCSNVGAPPTFFDDGAGVFLGVDPCIRQNGPNGATQASVFTGGAADNHVRNSYIGSDYVGTASVPNSVGVWLNYDAGRDTISGTGNPGNVPGNHIGGCVVFPFTAGANAACANSPQTVDSEQDSNLISGNRYNPNATRSQGGHGIWLNGPTTAALVIGSNDVDYNEIGGNFIGTDGAGIARLPNGGNGVYLLANQNASNNGPDHNEIGATTEYLPIASPYRAPYTNFSYRFGNLISGNGDPLDYDITLGNFDNGVEIRGNGANNNRVAYGNTIGLNSQGTNLPNDVGNGENGVLVQYGAVGNYIHNNSGASISSVYAPATLDAVSVFGAISDNGDFDTGTGRRGIWISSEAMQNHIFRNCIGGDAVDTPGGNFDDCDGTTYGNHNAGVYISNLASNNYVGAYAYTGNDAADDQRNWIHHNGRGSAGDGVSVVDDGTYGIMIRFNSIWLNDAANADGNLGIDLGDNNDTLNDAGDPDLGPNNYQNFPYDPADETRRPIGSSTFQITFATCASCVADFYAMPLSEADYPVNNGEGKFWLTSAVGTGASQTVSVQAEIQALQGSGQLPSGGDVCVTMTTTNPGDTLNTSEFTPCIPSTPNAVTLSSLQAQPTTSPVVPVALIGVSVATLIGAVFVIRRRKTA